MVLLSCRGILLSPRREAGRTARGLAPADLNLLIALELLRVFAGSSYPPDLRWEEREGELHGFIWGCIECDTVGGGGWGGLSQCVACVCMRV